MWLIEVFGVWLSVLNPIPFLKFTKDLRFSRCLYAACQIAHWNFSEHIFKWSTFKNVWLLALFLFEKHSGMNELMTTEENLHHISL